MRHGLPAVVDPGVIGALLHQDVAGLDMDLGVVEQHVDLAVEHDGVIDGAGAVGVLVPRIALRRRIDAHVDQDLVMIDGAVAAGRRRREIDDAEDGAVGGRRHADLGLGAVGRARHVDGKLAGHPA